MSNKKENVTCERFSLTSHILLFILLTRRLLCVKQIAACVLYEVERIVEVGGAAVIGVGHHAYALMVLEIVGEHLHLCLCFLCRSLGRNDAIVVVVHDEQLVKTREVVNADLACMAVEGVSAACSALSHSAVRKLSYVPVAYSCRVDEELVLSSCVCHHLLHYSFSSRRATDIAETDEEQFLFLIFHSFCHLRF